MLISQTGGVDSIATVGTAPTEMFVTLRNPDLSPDFVGIAGLLATTVVSVIALWLSHRSRRTSLQDRIHAAQLDGVLALAPLLTRGMRTGIACNKACREGGAPSIAQQQAACDATDIMLNESVKFSLVFPRDLLAAYQALHEALKKCEVPTDRKQAESDWELLKKAHGGFSAAARRALGVDVLTAEVRSLLGTK